MSGAVAPRHSPLHATDPDKTESQ